MKRFTHSMVFALALLIATALSALAGGWAVITLDELPNRIVAGESFTIGFTVRQHGRTLRDDLTPIVRFDRADAKDSFIATAKRAGESGHYVGEVKFPSAGQWNWKVDIEQSGMVTQDMPPLSVLDAVPGAAPPTAAPSAAVPAPNSTAMPLAAGIVGLIGAIGGVIGYLRTRRRFALALAAVAVLIGALGFVSASSSVARPVEPQPVAARDGAAVARDQTAVARDGAAVARDQTAVARDGAAATRDQAALGRDLFMAKGCVMCHLHPDVQTKDGPYWIGAEPPALNNGKYTAEYLRVWLKDPAALKPQTEMPKLGLSAAEIEALIAFLTGK